MNIIKVRQIHNPLLQTGRPGRTVAESVSSSNNLFTLLEI